MDVVRRRRWADRVATWGAGVLVASVALAWGLHPVRAVLLGGLGAVVMSSALVARGRWARRYRERTAVVGLWVMVVLYTAAAAVCAWLRWGS